MDLQTLLGLATTTVAAWAPKVLGALAVLLFGWLLAGWIRDAARRALSASNVDAMLVPFLTGVIHVVTVVIVVIMAIGTIGIGTASFVAVLGAAGLAIALAFQGTFSNFAAGVMLLTFRPFEVGNWVEIGGEAGTVISVGVFSCTLHTADNVEVRVPNSAIFGSTIKNYSANPTRRIDLVVGVSYQDDLGLAVRTCREVLAAEPRVLAEPAPVVAVHELGDSSINLVVRPWVNTGDYWAARWDLTRALKESLESAGCSIPFPQRDLHLYQQAAS